MSKTLKVIGGVVSALAVVALLAVGGWQLGWWAQTSATNHIAHIYQNSYGAQSADEQEAQNLISQVNTINVEITAPSTPASEVSALQAQKTAIVTQACGLIANVNSPTPDVAQFASVNCN